MCSPATRANLADGARLCRGFLRPTLKYHPSPSVTEILCTMPSVVPLPVWSATHLKKKTKIGLTDNHVATMLSVIIVLLSAMHTIREARGDDASKASRARASEITQEPRPILVVRLDNNGRKRGLSPLHGTVLLLHALLAAHACTPLIRGFWASGFYLFFPWAWPPESREKRDLKNPHQSPAAGCRRCSFQSRQSDREAPHQSCIIALFYVHGSFK